MPHRRDSEVLLSDLVPRGGVGGTCSRPFPDVPSRWDSVLSRGRNNLTPFHSKKAHASPAGAAYRRRSGSKCQFNPPPPPKKKNSFSKRLQIVGTRTSHQPPHVTPLGFYTLDLRLPPSRPCSLTRVCLFFLMDGLLMLHGLQFTPLKAP